MLELLNRVYTIENKKRKYLYLNFRDMPIWNDINVWEGCYKKLISKCLNDIKAKKIKDSGLLTSFFGGVQEGIKGGFGRGKNFISSVVDGIQSGLLRKSEDQEMLEENQSKVLQLMCVYISNVKMDMEFSKMIIKTIGQKYNINIDIILPLLDDIEQNHQLEQFRKTIKPRGLKSKGEKWGRKIAILGSIPFLEIKNILSLSITSKTNKTLFRSKALTQLLINLKTEDQNLRFKLWSLLAGPVSLLV